MKMSISSNAVANAIARTKSATIREMWGGSEQHEGVFDNQFEKSISATIREMWRGGSGWHGCVFNRLGAPVVHRLLCMQVVLN